MMKKMRRWEKSDGLVRPRLATQLLAVQKVLQEMTCQRVMVHRVPIDISSFKLLSNVLKMRC